MNRREFIKSTLSFLGVAALARFVPDTEPEVPIENYGTSPIERAYKVYWQFNHITRDYEVYHPDCFKFSQDMIDDGILKGTWLNDSVEKILYGTSDRQPVGFLSGYNDT